MNVNLGVRGSLEFFEILPQWQALKSGLKWLFRYFKESFHYAQYGVISII